MKTEKVSENKISKNQVGKLIKVSGPLVIASGMQEAKMYDVVKVGKEKLIGEVIEIEGDKASIQVYEDTSGLGPGEPVYLTGRPLCVELGPGLIGSIFDGIQRPLNFIYQIAGDYISRGIEAPALDREKKWFFEPLKKIGDRVSGGDILGEIKETSLVIHKILVPPDIEGKITAIKKGEFSVEEVIAEIDTGKEKRSITMIQIWPIRQPRLIKQKIIPEKILTTGQRIIDTFFPIPKGGTACVPGPFGSGKTVIQHQLARWSDADIIIFIGCGERGNEITDILHEFPELKDPKSGRPLMERTILIANTSNMPVAAREASIYTGVTIGEYFRDMGYNVALMADSTSRWAEAMREISGRLEEMPGEEGYPPYLGSRIAAFYERAGRVECLSGENNRREGSLTIIGAVSPPGGDLSEPVTQNTLRVVKVFWGLDDKLANARHFPAINWLTSYSLYFEDLKYFSEEKIDEEWKKNRVKAMEILQKENELKSIIQLVGMEALSAEEQIILYTAQSIREDFLQQSAFDNIDTYTSLNKMFLILKAILVFHDTAEKMIQNGKSIKEIINIPFKEKIARLKFIPEKEISKIKNLIEEIKNSL